MDSNQQHFQKVRDYLLELEYDIEHVNEDETVLVIAREEDFIKNMVLVVDEPLLILEQPLFVLSPNNSGAMESLLRKNMDIVHGAFALTEDGYVIFRDTLQIENLDKNELEGSLNSLTLLLTEYYDELISFAKA